MSIPRCRAAGVVFLALITVAVPSSAAIEDDYREAFGERDRKVRASPATRDDVEFAAELLESAEVLEDQPALKLFILTTAADFGTGSREGIPLAEKALAAARKIAPESSADLSEIEIAIAEARYAFADSAHKAERAGEYVDALLYGADADIANGRIDRARGRLRDALRIAALLGRGLKSRVADKVTALNKAAARQAKYEKLLELHGKDPGDRKKLERLVLFLLVEEDRPKKAAAIAAGKVEGKLGDRLALAAKDVEELDKEECMALGDWYRGDLAGQASKAHKTNPLSRALDCYNRFLSLHEKKDTKAMKASLHIRSITEQLGKLRGRARLPAGAVLVMSFDRGTVRRSGGAYTVRDLSGNGNHGLMKNVGLTKGVAGSAARFTDDSSVVIRNSKSLQTILGQTIVMWLYPQKLAARRNPFNKCYGGEGTMTLETAGTINFFYGTSGENESPYTSINTSKTLTAGRWTHIALVRDMKRGEIMWYIDGVVTSRKTVRYSRMGASAEPVIIGNGYAGQFLGMIDELAIFNRGLPEKEVRYLYELGKKGRSF